MNPVHTIGISDCFVSNDPTAVLTTHALGSRIAVVIYDPVARVGGMLPDPSPHTTKALEHPSKCADTDISLLFHMAYHFGAVEPRLIVSALGGAQVIHTSDTFNIGKRSYIAMCKILCEAGVLVKREEVGGTVPLTVRLELETGRLLISSGRSNELPTRQLRNKKMNMQSEVKIVDEQRDMRDTLRYVLLSSFETGLYLEADDVLKTLEVLEREKVDIVRINMHIMCGKVIKTLFAESWLYYTPAFVLVTERSNKRMQKNAGTWGAFALDQSIPHVWREIRRGL